MVGFFGVDLPSEKLGFPESWVSWSSGFLKVGLPEAWVFWSLDSWERISSRNFSNISIYSPFFFRVIDSSIWFYSISNNLFTRVVQNSDHFPKLIQFLVQKMGLIFQTKCLFWDVVVMGREFSWCFWPKLKKVKFLNAKICTTKLSNTWYYHYSSKLNSYHP